MWFSNLSSAAGKSFTVSGFDERDTEELVLEIQDLGGKVVPVKDPGQVYFSLVNLDGTGTIHPRAREVISKYFIEDCIEQNVST